ncbi:MAG: hypothetical protein FWC16_12375 [Defluviitaleaceae bacterium]|nr:hypothetical protein [Defluviitaleaceae bacterium]MCL2275716.1 hypothetical protein [Defluviitaleaceae bacterium]
MGRRGGGGMRGGMGGGMRGGGRIGGGLSGGSGRIGGGGARGGGVRAPAPRVSAPRAAAPRQRSGVGSFGAGMATGMLLGGRRRSMWGWGGGWGWGRPRHVVHHHHGGGGGNGGGRGGCGCFTIILAAFLLIIGIALLGELMNLGTPGGGSTAITRSTVVREALPRGTADSTVPMIVDPRRWAPNQTEVERGMRNFYDRTGVRPILYITDNINGVQPWDLTDAQLRTYAEARYMELTGTNQAHVLLLFVVNANYEYSMWVTPGTAANRIMDGEAIDILMDYVDRFFATERDNARAFSRAFDQTGRAIMTVHQSPWVNVMIVAGVALILFLLYTWWKAKRDQKNLEAEQTERILNQDLTEFGIQVDDEASRLAAQYEDENDNQN